MKVVIDHIAGSRRGQRQQFDATDKLRFGRHPDNDVSFDAHRDLDASSRHAELRRGDGEFTLCDVGSSNGLLVGGERIAEIPIPLGQIVEVEFGVGGPRVRLWVGEDDDVPEPPSLSSVSIPVADQGGRMSRRALVLVIVLVAVVAAGVIALVTRAQCGGEAAEQTDKVGNYAAPVGAMRRDLRENGRAVTPGGWERQS